MFILESLNGLYAIDVSGRLTTKTMCLPKKFATADEAKAWATASGIRTPLVATTESEMNGFKESDQA